MKSHQVQRTAKTPGAPGFVDLTNDIESALRASGIKDGHVTVFLQHGGCSLFVNERESGLLADIKSALLRLSIAGSHEGHTMIGSSSVVLPATGGHLALGTWQRVFLVELEEPSDRDVVVQIVGE